MMNMPELRSGKVSKTTAYLVSCAPIARPSRRRPPFVLGNQMGFSPSEATLPLDLKKSTEGFWKSFISGLHSRQKKFDLVLKRPTRYFTTWQRTLSFGWFNSRRKQIHTHSGYQPIATRPIRHFSSKFKPSLHSNSPCQPIKVRVKGKQSIHQRDHHSSPPRVARLPPTSMKMNLDGPLTPHDEPDLSSSRFSSSSPLSSSPPYFSLRFSLIPSDRVLPNFQHYQRPRSSIHRQKR